MILKEVAEKRNKISYEIVKNSYLNSKISHNYLVSAPQLVGIDYFLYFLSQVIVCQENFACGQCNNCARILKNEYSDLYILDGSEKSIKKEEILSIQNILYQTALERKNVKILLIKNVENTSIQGLNSLLKLVEEPPNNTYIFISTNKINDVLPTIKSRSQSIRLMNISRDVLIDELLRKNVPNDDAFILSIVSTSSTTSHAFFKKDYLKYKEILITFFEKWTKNHNDSKIFLLNIDYKKINIKLFLRLFLAFLNDIWRSESNKSISYKNNIVLLNLLSKKKFPVFKFIELTSQLLVDLGNNVNIKLQIYAWVIDMFGDDNDR